MPDIKYNTDWKAAAALILASLLWGTSFVVLKAAMATYGPYMLIFGRLAVAAVLFAPLLITRRRCFRYRPGTWKLIVLMVLCEPCLYFLMEVEALRRTTASQAGMVTALLPLLVAWGGFLFLKERVSGRSVAGFVLAVLGTCWLSLSGPATASAPAPLLGNFLEFVAMVCSTGFILCTRYLTARFGYSPVLITAMQAVGGTLFYLPVLGMPGSHPGAYMQAGYLLVIVYLGAAITIGAYGLYNFGVSRLPAGQAAAFVNLIPASTVFWGWLLLGERFSPAQYAASMLILAGIYLSQGLNGSRKAEDKKITSAAARS